MALGMMVPSMVSGWMQKYLGYEQFFIVAGVLGLVTFAVVPLTFKIFADSDVHGKISDSD
jgi:MFS family permease